MLALIALICFVLAFFGVDLAGHSLVILGLAFIAAHLLLGGGWLPTFRRGPG